MQRVVRMAEARLWEREGTSKERRALQREVRAVEAVARRSALATLRLGERRGLGCPHVARRLGVSRRTLRHWQKERAEIREARLRGRPSAAVPREERTDVLAFLSVLGPRASLAVLRGRFRDLPPAALEDLRLRFREACRRGRTQWMIRALRWKKPGWVWAMDFADAPSPVDDEYPYLLLVRDLASGRQLAALPCPDPTAATVKALLAALFLEYGHPLVIKCDNGSAFLEFGLNAWLGRLGILRLFSPPALPAYNGGCEAGVGSIKTRAHHEAARHDRPGCWTSDDVEAARRQANETARPWGWRGPTPDHAFARRRAPTFEERRAFLVDCATYELEERAARDISEVAELDHYDQASIDRVAIGRALTQHNILEFRRRRITLPFNSHSRARIP